MITHENTSGGPRLVKTSAGVPGKYFEVITSDTARGFTTSELLDAYSNTPVYAFIEISDSSVRFTYDSTNPPTTSGFGLTLAEGLSWELLGYAEISSFMFVSETAGTPAKLRIQFWY